MSFPDESSWRDALEEALAACPPDRSELTLFHEEREDLVSELDGRDGSVRAQHSLLAGLSASHAGRESDRLCYMAAPRPQDARRLLAAVLGHPESGSEPEQGAPAQSFDPDLSAAAASKVLVGLVETSSRLQPRAALRARWVGFVQQVQLARPGQPVITDVRRGSRVRLEARLAHNGGGVVAVGEAVLPSTSDRETIQRLCRQVARRLEQRREMRALACGTPRLVFAPGVGGVLIHEIVGHALEADVLFDGLSWIAGEGQKLAPAGLCVFDDPLRGRGAWRFDDEGAPARPTELLLDGCVAGRLHDGRSARRSGRTSTGHGRRASFRDPVKPRMGCTFVGAGKLEPEDVLEGVHEGTYVRRMEAASVDPCSGHALFRVTDADRIEHGRIGNPLVPHLIAIDAAGALSSLDRIADDLVFDTCIGSCLRDGQALPASVGSPTFRIGKAIAIA